MLILMHVDVAAVAEAEAEAEAEADADAVASFAVVSFVLCIVCCPNVLFNLRTVRPFSILSTSGTLHKPKRLWLHKVRYIIVWLKLFGEVQF